MKWSSCARNFAEKDQRRYILDGGAEPYPGKGRFWEGVLAINYYSYFSPDNKSRVHFGPLNEILTSALAE